MALIAAAQAAQATSATLSWDASTSPGVAGYLVHYGIGSGLYAWTMDAGNSTTVTIPDLQSGKTYYFAVTSYDVSGTQSSLSNEATFGSGTPGGGLTTGAVPPGTGGGGGGGGGCAATGGGRPDPSLPGLLIFAALTLLRGARARRG